MSVPAEQMTGTTPNSSGVEARRDPPGGDPSNEAVAAQQAVDLVNEFLEEDGILPETPPTVTPEPAPVAAPVVEPTPAPAPVVAPLPDPAAVQPAPVQPPAPTPVTTQPVTPVEPVAGTQPPAPAPQAMTEADVQKWMTESQDKLAKEFYSFSDEQMAEYEERPADFLSKQLARAHMQILTTVSAAVTQHLPQMMQHVTRVEANWQDGVKQFYSAWPELAKHRATVEKTADRMAIEYRARNPMATAEEVIREVGAMVHLAHRIPIPNLISPPQDPTNLPPYSPPQGGGGIAPVAQPLDQWGTLAKEFMEEDIA